MHFALTLLLAACSQFAGVKSWVGTITVTYDRTAHTPYYIEHSYGDSAETVRYAPSVIGSIAFNGYDETWQGKSSGTGNLVATQTNADGSELSHPVRLEGSGPLVADPPLGEFGPEQFWINSAKCLYGFYTSAAIHAMHSRDGAMVAGSSVHVEALPLPRSGALRGSKHFHLPNRNYYGGDQFHIPCLMIDWCSRDAGTGDATVTWIFTPGSGVAPYPTPSMKPVVQPHCPKADSNSGSRIDRIRADLAKALAARGYAVSLSDISAKNSGGLVQVIVRLDSFGRILPSDQCISEGIANGSVPPHSLSGAWRMVLGAVQQTASQTRVTVHTVDVATGVIRSSGLGDASGTGDAAVQQAATSAFTQLGHI